MNTNTDNTDFAAAHQRGPTTVRALVEHLEAMERYAIGIGEVNASAAGIAASFIRTIAADTGILDTEI